MRSNCLQEVIRYHNETLGRNSFPFYLTEAALDEPDQKNYHLFPTLTSPAVFYMMENNSGISGLDFPIIKHLTVLEPLQASDLDIFVEYLQNLGNRFLVLMESYNNPGMKLLKTLNPKKTFYCQQKLLHCLDKTNNSHSKTPDGISIRNFVPGKDEVQYAAFYNKVLGFLGSIVDKAFVDAIVARSSFDHRGYFLAESKGSIVGFLSIEKEPWGEHGSKFGYIYQIGVAESWRSSGLAGALVGKALDFALTQGLNRIGVGVRKSNESAIKFFTKEGFRKIYEVNGYLINLYKIK